MSAYNETCAAIGNVYWNHRLFLLHGEAKYMDVLERTLYNGLISGVSLDGKLFFYPNPLAAVGQHARSPWFGCACCPGNVTRFIASVPGYVYAYQDDKIFINLYISNQATIEFENKSVKIEQETNSPWDGAVKIKIHPSTNNQSFSILLRIPGWAQKQPIPSDLYHFLNVNNESPVLKVNDNLANFQIKDGYAEIKRKWNDNDAIELELPLPIRRIIAHDSVATDRGRVALQRGPIVYCAEWPDNPEGHILNLLLPDSVSLTSEFRADWLNGVAVIQGKIFACKAGNEENSLEKTEQDFMAIPYYAWAHRGKGAMAVWLAREESAVQALGRPTIASESHVSASFGKNPEAIHDQMMPQSSGDQELPFYHWWPHKGTTEWVQYDFKQPEEVSTVEVY